MKEEDVMPADHQRSMDDHQASMDDHQRATDAQFSGHMKVCELRFQQQAEQNKHIDERLKDGDQLMRDLRDLLVRMEPLVKRVELHENILVGPDMQGGLVLAVRENKQALDRINKTAAAIIGLVTTNIGTLLALVWNWLTGGGHKG